MVKYFFLIGLMLAGMKLHAQDSNKIIRQDSGRHALLHKRVLAVQHAPVSADSILTSSDYFLSPSGNKKMKLITPVNIDSFIFRHHLFFQFSNPITHSVTLKKWKGKEAIFYSMMALLIFFALIRNGFHRYITDLFKIFFRTTVKQRQIKDQLVQSPLPSFLLNVFFLLSVGMFLALVFQYYKLGLEYSFWMLFVYSLLGLLAVYGLKFLSLKLLGWVFQVSEATNAYIFIVFATNKIIGMALLPFLVVLAFTYGMVSEVAMNLSVIVVGGLFAYRFFLSYVTIHRQVRISFFHFFLYLCAFELAPLLLINKLLFRFLGETS